MWETTLPPLSQRKLAAAVDITNASLSAIKNDATFPSEEVFLGLLERLSPPAQQRESMLNLYAPAKDIIPPDISVFLKRTPQIYDFMRNFMQIELTSEKIDVLQQQIGKL